MIGHLSHQPFFPSIIGGGSYPRCLGYTEYVIPRSNDRTARSPEYIQEFIYFPRPDKSLAHVINDYKLAPPVSRARVPTRPNSSFSLFRFLFPLTRQRAKARLLALRHEALPHYRHQAQSHIYRFIVKHQHRNRQRRDAGTSILGRLAGRRSRQLSASPPNNALPSRGVMSQQVDLRDDGSGHGSAPEGGSRRRKIAGYLKAANDLRQSYQQSYGLSRHHDDETDENGSGIPGAFPDLASARHGKEEMVLFPSYARRLNPRGDRSKLPGASPDLRSSIDTGDIEYWKREWERYEEENSVVELDVRGWIYSPHRGVMTRKNRVLVGIARQLSGIPAPVSSGPNSVKDSVEGHAARHDEELVEKQAESIIRKGEDEADLAGQGRYSEKPGPGSNGFRDYTSCSQSKALRLDRLDPMSDGAKNPGLQEKRASWIQPSDMSPAELSAANAHLMARLKPFLTTPLANIPLTIFFYNKDTSKSRTIATDDYGHFSIRAALDFVPTNIRVLASEKLSATEEVIITEHRGVSVVSDIDDTIKHSAISSGAREIFRNTFIRELQDLHIEGVEEWYNRMADLGAKFHYVSNSPWQLYPVLVNFFAGAGLPNGSFHLKQYSGMLQGIFEPVAERKKGTLEKIIQDFPERRFILVGDSGEADLELYSELVTANVGRILGIFIRDVTTTLHQGFFDSSMRAVPNEPITSSSLRGRQSNAGTFQLNNLHTNSERPPPLPPRQRTRSTSDPKPRRPAMGTLIDFDDEPSSPRLHRSKTESVTSPCSPDLTPRFKIPSPPSKPSYLRSHPTGDDSTASPSFKKGAPPLLPKPPQYATSQDSFHPTNLNDLTQTRSHPVAGTNPIPAAVDPARTLPATVNRASSLEPQGYRSTVRNKVAEVYNAIPSRTKLVETYNSLPALRSSSQPPTESTPPTNSRKTSSSTTMSATTTTTVNPAYRRPIVSYPAAAAQYASDRWNGYSSNPSTSSFTDSITTEDVHGNSTNLNPAINKKEDLWKRRWARAKEVMDAQGVMLRSWRMGDDVVEDAVGLIRKAMEEDKRRESTRVGNNRNAEHKGHR